MEPSTPAAQLRLSEFIQAIDEAKRADPKLEDLAFRYYRLPTRDAVYLMLTGQGDRESMEWREDRPGDPNYYLKLFDEAGNELAVDAEVLRQGRDLPDGIFVRLEEVALHYLNETWGRFYCTAVPWRGTDGRWMALGDEATLACEQRKVFKRYSDFKRIVLQPRFPGMSDRELVMWLLAGDLTARDSEYANARAINFGSFFHVEASTQGDEEQRLQRLLVPCHFSESEWAQADPERWLSYAQLKPLAERGGVSEPELMATIERDLAWLTDIADPIPRRPEEERTATVEEKIRRSMFRASWVKEAFPHIDLTQAQANPPPMLLCPEGEAVPQACRPAFSLDAQARDYADALRQDAWEVWEAMCWLHGRTPHYYQGSVAQDYPVETDAVKRAVNAGILTPQSTPPSQWITWALSKDWEVPEPLRQFVETQPEPGPPDPRRLYPQAFGIKITVAELRRRWGLPHNKYLDEMARLRELTPLYHDGMDIQVRPKGLACEFGIPPAVQWVNTGTGDNAFVSYDVDDVTWVGTLPDDAY